MKNSSFVISVVISATHSIAEQQWTGLLPLLLLLPSPLMEAGVPNSARQLGASAAAKH